MMTRNKLIIKIIIDLLCMFLAFLPWIVLQTGIKPFQRGFFCNDESLMHPYHDTTISSTIVLCLGIGINVVIFLATEAVLKFVYHEKEGKALRVRHGYSEMEIHPYIVDCYKVTGVFLFGAAFQQSVVNVLKYSVGRLRPHFFEMCKPNWTEFQCKDERGFYVYVTDAICTGTNLHRVHESRLSFPSGHSSLAFYFAVFFVLYSQVKWTWKFSKLLTHLCQIMALFAALAVCVSRISDYKHHWSDVLAGALLGSSVSFVMEHVKNILVQTGIPSISYLTYPAVSLVTSFFMLMARYNSGLYKQWSAKKFCDEVTAVSKKYNQYGAYSSDLHGEVNLVCKSPTSSQYDSIPGENKQKPQAKQFADSV